MSKDTTNLEALSTRKGFNSAVRHIKKTVGIAGELDKDNLADILYEMGDDDISGERIGLLLRMLLIDKLGYAAVSTNLVSVVDDPAGLAEEFAKWKGVDLVVAYHHPEMGLLVANPKIPEELAGLGDLRKRELMVAYAGKPGKAADENCKKAAELALSLFEGAKPKAPPAILKGNFAARKLVKRAKEAETPVKPKAPKAKAPPRAAPKPVAASRVAAPVSAAGGPFKMTPRYAVVVQNELFHNGNVEAWKRIIASYKASHPALEVFIYYEGERILDINSLFKWGKVKHGSAIEFAVSGNEIQDVAKLQRYLSQGASNQFEVFLHGPVNTVLKLF